MLLASFMDCAGISPEDEGRAMQWLRGTGRRLRVDGDCVVSVACVRSGRDTVGLHPLVASVVRLSVLRLPTAAFCH